MKKVFFLFLVFFCLSLEAKASWTKFYEDCTDEEKKEILSSSPLLRLEIKRHERGNQSYFDIDAYSLLHNQRDGIRSIFKQKDQYLRDTIRQEIPLKQEYANKVVIITLDGQSNFLEVGGLSLNHNFDIVTNMRLRLLDSLVSNKQIRVFSEYEIANSARIRGNPSVVMDDRALLKKIVKDHVEKNPKLLNSSRNKDIVVFLGKTGSGKSTLINYLSDKKLRVDEEDNIILVNSSDASAMRIGISSRSETLLPKFTNINNLIVYDLPGFGDTRGTSINLVNACFIKNIIEGAKTARLVFIAGYDEITAGRGALLRELSQTTENLLPNIQIEECSSLVITKSPADKDKKRLITILGHKTDPGSLNGWIDQGRLTKMSSPFNQQINQDDRQDIFDIIDQTPTKQIKNVNIQAIYSYSDLDHLRKIYSEEIHDSFVKLKDDHFKGTALSSLDIKVLTKMKEDFQHNTFLKNLEEQLKQSALITLLRPISEQMYTDAWNLKQNQLVLELRNIGDVIEEEITKRKRNLLVSPKIFAETLDKIADISELLKKSQTRLGHKKQWTTEVLNEICGRNYLLIRGWLDNILSKRYNTLNESNLTYAIPEVFGKNQEWIYYSKPILYKLIFEKIEDDKTGYNYVTFTKYNPDSTAQEKKSYKGGVQFKRTEHTEEMRRALELDRNYQSLFTQEKQLNQKLEDCSNKYEKQCEKKNEEKNTRENNADKSRESSKKDANRYFEDGYRPGYNNIYNNPVILYKGDNDRLNRKISEIESNYEKILSGTSSWYDDEIRKIDRNKENEKEIIYGDQNEIRLKKERYENETYRKTTAIDPKEKQINDIMQNIIKPNFNVKSFIESIEFGDTEIKDSSIKSQSKKRKEEVPEDRRSFKKRKKETIKVLDSIIEDLDVSEDKQNLSNQDNNCSQQ